MQEKKKILIVEDDPALSQLMKTSFEKEGFLVETASDGLQGLNMAREHPPDLVILNVMMPIMDGYHVCRYLKFDKKYMHIPIIMVTGMTQEDEKNTGLAAGANEYVFKPFDIKVLIVTVRRYLL